MAKGGLKGSQKVAGGSTGSNAGMTNKSVVGANVRNASGRSIGGSKAPRGTGGNAKAVVKPAPRRKGVSY